MTLRDICNAQAVSTNLQRASTSFGKSCTACAKIYDQEFGGKERGRYKIARPSLRRLTGNKRLRDSAISDITDAALDAGYVLIDLGDYFAVVEETVMLNYRPVPKSVLAQVLEGRADAAEDEET